MHSPEVAAMVAMAADFIPLGRVGEASAPEA
jgi:hypothetical protein